MPLFKHHIAFQPIDPLGNGLREEIVAEQADETNAIALTENVNEDELTNFWQSVETDIEHDPEWFNFTEEE